MGMKKPFTIFLFWIGISTIYAQSTQVIQGKVIDKESKAALVSVSVRVLETNLGAISDTNGNFKISNVPLGKHRVVFTYLGYLSSSIPDVLVTSAKEVILLVEMEESAELVKEVSVEAKREHINEMALVSAKTFDVEEVDRYAGSRSDVPRMASNFAGVQGGDDSRNDIVIRGNSPEGVVWRIEDLDVPNPNHFNIPGTTGGPVTMLNNKTLANSAFYTGAFTAEYGNGVAGVFDIHLRNGNPDRYEFTGQLGFLGAELAAEGPISIKDGSSFLVAYRYSTLQFFELAHISIGTLSVPHYQDINFKLNFPIGKDADLTFFGIGGLSNIDLVVSKLSNFSPDLYGETDRDQYYTSNTGILGIAFSYNINKNTYTKIVIGETANDIFENDNYVERDSNYKFESLKPVLGFDYRTVTTSTHWFLTKKFSARHILQFGIIDNLYNLKFIDSSREYPVNRPDWTYPNNFTGSANLLQAYIQFKYRPSDNVSITAGLHAQYLSLSQSKALEPRLAAKWVLDFSNALSFGYGLHSEAIPFYQYFSFVPSSENLNTGKLVNENVDFIRSHHFVLGFDHNFSNVWRMKIETYYQYLFNVPIETREGSSFTVLDQGADYLRYFPDTLVNKGTGYNYGLEFTLSKLFSRGFYMLFTASLFDSKAKGNDGVYRSTDYNSHYILNLLGGYETKIGTNTTLISGLKITFAGGRLYSPPDTAKSIAQSQFVPIDSKRNTLEFQPYFRTDVKLGVRINAKKITHEIGLDLVNIFNTMNVLSDTYSIPTTGKGTFFYTYQLGFLPLFYYRVDFGFEKKKASN